MSSDAPSPPADGAVPAEKGAVVHRASAEIEVSPGSEVASRPEHKQTGDYGDTLETFGPTGPPSADLAHSDSIDLLRATVSKQELIELTSIGSRGDPSAWNSFKWTDGSVSKVLGKSPESELKDFYNIEALEEFTGLYDYADGSRVYIVLDYRRQQVTFRSADYNSVAERRMHEIRSAASRWSGANVKNRSAKVRFGFLALTWATTLAACMSLYLFVYSVLLGHSLEEMQGGAGSEQILPTAVTGLASGALAGLLSTLLETRRNRPRAFVMYHPDRRAWNDDRIQTWLAGIGIVVAIVLGLLAILL